MKDIGFNTSHNNPRLQCCFCGKWKRQFNAARERIMVNAEMADSKIGPTWSVVNKEGYLADVCAEHYEELGKREALAHIPTKS